MSTNENKYIAKAFDVNNKYNNYYFFRHVSNKKRSRLDINLTLEFKADLFKKVANFAIFHRNNWKQLKVLWNILQISNQLY